MMASAPELLPPFAVPRLRAAVRDLSWLLSRGYPPAAATALVGDRHNLDAVGRRACAASACAAPDLRRRLHRRVPLRGVACRAVAIDGLNCLTVVRTACRGGTVLRGLDGALRDLAGVRGAFRMGEDLEPLVDAAGAVLAAAGSSTVTWYLDRPVSRSGDLRALLLRRATAKGWPWQAEVVADPDPILASSEAVVATGDGWILDRCMAWVDLAGGVIDRLVPEAEVLDLMASRRGR